MPTTPRQRLRTAVSLLACTGVLTVGFIARTAAADGTQGPSGQAALTAAEASGPRATLTPRPSASRLRATIARRPTLGPSPSGCVAVVYAHAWYCSGSLPDVQATAYGVGRRVVLRDVSVTSVTTHTVTVSALDWQTCPPDVWGCPGDAVGVDLVLAWSGAERPEAGRATNLFGTTTTGSLVPVGFTPSDACSIDWGC